MNPLVFFIYAYEKVLVSCIVLIRLDSIYYLFDQLNDLV